MALGRRPEGGGDGGGDGGGRRAAAAVLACGPPGLVDWVAREGSAAGAAVHYERWW